MPTSVSNSMATCSWTDVHRSSGGVSDPGSPSGCGSRLRHVQFRMPRRLACIVSATDFLFYTVDPRDWTTNQINDVRLFGRDTPSHTLCRRSPFAFCHLRFCCVNRHRGGDLRRPQFFPQSQSQPLVSSTFPATCLFATVSPQGRRPPLLTRIPPCCL